MKLSYEDHDAITVLRVSGELTADQVDSFRRSCQDRINAGIRNIVLDMEHMTLIDSAGLEFLLWLSEEIASPSSGAMAANPYVSSSYGSSSGQLRLVKPDETVRRILYVTRLDKRFDIFDTIEAAARSLR
ncbi:MAG TPA: STAS domain-containing protein [Phycisphaerales bacterium]|nr:STAS domain-containing protein [Phycisphaerales bacterium]HRQ76127.1 STAS domain-containing protein [Phycisphaerales bacterium]